MTGRWAAFAVVIALAGTGCSGQPLPNQTAGPPATEVAQPTRSDATPGISTPAPSANPLTITWQDCSKGCLQIAIDSFTFAGDWGCSDFTAPVPSGEAVLRLHVTVNAVGSGEGFVGGFGFVGAYLHPNGKVTGPDVHIGPSFCDAPINTPEVWGPVSMQPGQPISGWLQYVVPAAGRLTMDYGVGAGESNEVVLRP